MKARTTLAALACSAVAAHASVTNISQFRFLQASGSGFPTSERSTAAMGIWSESVEYRDGPNDYDSGGVATQNSSISPFRFLASGTTRANDSVQVTSGSGRSSFDATFDVTTNAPYSFAGSWSTLYDGWAIDPACTMLFQRLSPSPLIFHHSRFVVDLHSGLSITSGTASLAGILTPGRYRVLVDVAVRVGADRGSFTGGNGFSIDLHVPAAGTLPLLAFAAFARRSRRA